MEPKSATSYIDPKHQTELKEEANDKLEAPASFCSSLKRLASYICKLPKLLFGKLMNGLSSICDFFCLVLGCNPNAPNASNHNAPSKNNHNNSHDQPSYTTTQNNAQNRHSSVYGATRTPDAQTQSSRMLVPDIPIPENIEGHLNDNSPAQKTQAKYEGQTLLDTPIQDQLTDEIIKPNNVQQQPQILEPNNVEETRANQAPPQISPQNLQPLLNDQQQPQDSLNVHSISNPDVIAQIAYKKSIDVLFNNLINRQNDNDEMAKIHLTVLADKIHNCDNINDIIDKNGNTVPHLFAMLLNSQKNSKFKVHFDKIADILGKANFNQQNSDCKYPLDLICPASMTPKTAQLFMDKTDKNIVMSSDFIYELMSNHISEDQNLENLHKCYQIITSHQNFNPHLASSKFSNMSILNMSASIPSGLDSHKILLYLFVFEGFLARQDLDVNHACQGVSLPVMLTNALEAALNKLLNDDNPEKFIGVLANQLEKISCFIRHCIRFNKTVDNQTIKQLKQNIVTKGGKLTEGIQKVAAMLNDHATKIAASSVTFNQNDTVDDFLAKCEQLKQIAINRNMQNSVEAIEQLMWLLKKYKEIDLEISKSNFTVTQGNMNFVTAYLGRFFRFFTAK